MRVFKGYFTIIKRNLRYVMFYFGIFLAVALSSNSLKNQNQKHTFEETVLKIAVVDREQGAIGKGVTDYVRKNHEFVMLEDDKEVLQEALFYREVNYVLIVPKDAAKRLEQGSKVLETTKVPGTDTGYYADQQLNAFLNNIRTYVNSGYEVEEAVEKALKLDEIESKVEMSDRNGNAGRMKAHINYLSAMPYLMIAMLSCSVGLVLMEFKKKDIRQRMTISCASLKRQNLEAILAIGVIGIGLWIAVHVMGVILYRKAYVSDGHIGGFLINTFALMLVSLAFAFLAGAFVKNIGAIIGFTNIVSLGMSFLGGVFVPIEVLGSDVQKIAQFLPVYWYAKVNTIFGKYQTLTPELKQSVFKGIVIQILFAVACISISLVINKYREQEEN